MSQAAYEIGTGCIECGSCLEPCPHHAIVPGYDSYRILPELCKSCGRCQALCPVGAISSK